MMSVETLWVYNPEHDLCLATGDAHFVAPESALRLGDDCCEAMRWIGEADELCRSSRGLCCSSRGLARVLREVRPERVVPWGWNAVLTTQLRRLGVAERLLPSADELGRWRALQHRSTAVRCASWLASRGVEVVECAFAASVDEVVAAVSGGGDWVLKAPWSGSGRGLRWVRWPMSGHDLGWVARMVRTQGGVAVERRCRRVCDWAMLFAVDEEVSFTGYSLFATRGGVYAGNWLRSDGAVERLVGELVGLDVVRRVRAELAEWLRQEVWPCYRGPVGVDMLVYEDEVEGGARLHPMVELNLRHTMGMVAHGLLARRPELEGGWMGVERAAAEGEGYVLQVRPPRSDWEAMADRVKGMDCLFVNG